MFPLLACLSPLATAPEAMPAAPTPLANPAAPVQLTDATLAGLLKNPTERLLVVNFWASWCGPCVEELALLSRAAATYTKASFVLVNVDEGRDQAQAAALLRARKIAVPSFELIAVDPATTLRFVVAAWPDSIPVTLVIEPGGHERARFRGSVPELALDAALRAP